MIQALLRLLYPPKCVFCGKIVESDTYAVCTDCRGKILYNTHACRTCGVPLDTVYGDGLCTSCRAHDRGFSDAYIPLIYKDAVRKAVIGYKFRGKCARRKTFAAFIFMKMQQAGAPCPDVVTFVPLHKKRLAKRGYDQAYLLAKELGKLLRVPVVRTLHKVKDLTPQSGKARRERMQAVRNAYAFLEKADVRGKYVLLVDDVVTTGATMHACARRLKQAGAKEVKIAAIAGTPLYH